MAEWDGGRRVAIAGRGGAADGQATRQALLDAAVHLFADSGIEAVSVRAVNRAAGVAPAAVHYHFGSKAALLRAVVARQGEAVVGEMMQRGHALLAAATEPSPRAIIEVLSEPYRALLGREPEIGKAWMRVVAQLSIAGDELVGGTEAEINVVLGSLVHRAFPAATESECRRALRLAVITLIQLLVQPADDAPGPHSKPYEDVVVDFVTGGLVAASGSGALVASQAHGSHHS
jgi:AcrR family transcriptional regulator